MDCRYWERTIPISHLLIGAFLIVYLTSCAGSRESRRESYPHNQKGIACWYHLPGNLTASGEPYSTKDYTAAHRTLPFGSIVDVHRLDNGREVRVRINDRGPFVKGRIIDLNRSAASNLDLINIGLAPVEIRVVKASY